TSAITGCSSSPACAGPSPGVRSTGVRSNGWRKVKGGAWAERRERGGIDRYQVLTVHDIADEMDLDVDDVLKSSTGPTTCGNKPRALCRTRGGTHDRGLAVSRGGTSGGVEPLLQRDPPGPQRPRSDVCARRHRHGGGRRRCLVRGGKAVIT